MRQLGVELAKQFEISYFMFQCSMFQCTKRKVIPAVNSVDSNGASKSEYTSPPMCVVMMVPSWT